MSDIRPCPFCGSRNLAVGLDTVVWCEDCGASGPDAADREHLSIQNWNRRATPRPLTAKAAPNA